MTSDDTPDPTPNLPLPDPGFNPFKARPEQLSMYKLPARPDPDTEPALYQMWSGMFSAPVEFVDITSVATSPQRADKRARLESVRVGPIRMQRARQRLTSLNWSGGFAYPRMGTRFVQVCGTWVVPAARTGSPVDTTLPRRLPNGRPPMTPLPYRCSIWVGLDGRRRWADAMPQLGTEHREDGSARFWWQWWTPQNKKLQHYVPEIEVRAGDQVYCNLSIVNGDTAHFHFLNRCTGKFGTVEVVWPGHVRGTSAQWILERPGLPVLVGDKLYNAGLHPMPDFGQVMLEGFAARAESVTKASGPVEVDGLALRATSNRTTRSNPRRTAIVSSARRHPGSRKLLLDYKG